MAGGKRKKPGVAFWAAVVLAAVVAYLLSIGPACWFTCRAERGEELVSTLFRPILRNVSSDRSQPLRRLVFWYSQWGCSDPRWGWFRVNDPSSPDGVSEWQWGQLPKT
jgi:hypothetical protein